MDTTNTTGGNGEAVATSVGLPGGDVTYKRGPWELGNIHSGHIEINSFRGAYRWNGLASVVWKMAAEDVSLDCQANARLIAAAPELLEALKNLLTLSENADETGYVDGEGWLPMEDIQAKARAAIAKALGTEPGTARGAATNRPHYAY